MIRAHILVAEGDAGIRRNLSDYLTRLGYEVDAAGSYAEALERLAGHSYAVAVTDCGLSDPVGALLRDAGRLCPETAVVVMSDAPTVPSVIGALRDGAFDYIVKPFEVQDLAAILPRAVSRWRERGGENAAASADEGELIGVSDDGGIARSSAGG